jgi:hypothetical protein
MTVLDTDGMDGEEDGEESKGMVATDVKLPNGGKRKVSGLRMSICASVSCESDAVHWTVAMRTHTSALARNPRCRGLVLVALLRALL